MGNSVEVILLESVPGLGDAGDIITVSDGYARNKLFPAGQAALATSEAKNQQQAKQKKAEAATAAHLAELQAQAEALDDTELTLEAKVKDGTSIFGSITAANIAKELSQQTKWKFKTKQVVLPEPITELGEHKVTIQLEGDTEARVQVSIVPDAESKAATKETNE